MLGLLVLLVLIVVLVADHRVACNYTRACPYLDNEAKNRLNRQQNKANCADNIGILSNNLTQFCQI